MAEPYLSQLQELIAEFDLDQSAGSELICKHFFSGAAAYRDGVIFMSLSPAGLALKLPENDRAILMGAGGRPLRYFPKSPVKKDYVVVPEDLVADWPRLRVWIERSLASL